MLYSSYYFTFPFPRYEVLISYSLSFGHSLWIMHIYIYIYILFPASSLPFSPLPALFFSFQPNSRVSVSISTSERQSEEKMRSDTLSNFIVCLHSLLRPAVVDFRRLSSAWKMQKEIFWFFMWCDLSRGWLGGRRESVWLKLSSVYCWMFKSLKSTPDKVASPVQVDVN